METVEVDTKMIQICSSLCMDKHFGIEIFWPNREVI